MKCILDLNKIEIESRDIPVFFSTHEFVIYREPSMGRLEMSDCSGEVLVSTRCPNDWMYYECLDMEDAILFIFAGKEIIVFDKMGHLINSHKIDPYKIGRVLTKPLQGIHENSIVFGTRTTNGIQIIHYDFMKQERLSQSSSWKSKKINDAVSDGNMIYALMDNSFLAACSISSCETIWTRFEANLVVPKLVVNKDGLFWISRNTIRKRQGKDVENIRIPIPKLSNLHDIVEGKFLVTTNEAKNVCLADVEQGRTEWEITGEHSIVDSYITYGQSNVMSRIMLFVSDTNLGLINLTNGRTISYGLSKNISRIRQTGDHILLSKYDGTTDMIAGMQNESF